jgi:hypothetical protein
MAVTVPDLRSAAAAVAAAVRTEEQRLNAADRVLGDGDTGITVRRMLEQVERALADSDTSDIGVAFCVAGNACAEATGSSLGTLCAVSLLEIGKATRGKESLADDEIGSLLLKARDTMLARGGAALGDKTIMDVVDATGRAIGGAMGAAAIGAAALASAEETLAAFRSQPSRAGRARKFGERSIGHDDPGMLAFTIAVAALADGNNGNC